MDEVEGQESPLRPRVMPWFRLYHEVRRDAKLRALSRDERWTWLCLVCYASEQVELRGTIPPLDPYVLAVEVCDGDEALLQATLAKCCRLGMLVTNDDGAITVRTFERRQHDYPSDAPEKTRQRQAQHRAKANLSRVVTSESRPVTARHNTELDRDRELKVDGELTTRTTELKPETLVTRGEGGMGETTHPPTAEPRGVHTPSAPHVADALEPPTPMKRTAATKEGKPLRSKAVAPNATPDGYEFLQRWVGLTHATLTGDERRREAIQADALLRRTGGDLDEAEAYVRYRLEHGQSPALQWSARDYAPGWINRTNGARASPNGKSSIADMLALDARESEEERIRGARRINDQAVAASAAVV